MINNNYVLLNILNEDVFNQINQYIINPYIEIKEYANNNYITNIEKIYDNYVHYSMRKINNYINMIKYSNNAEDNDYTRETINDIYYDIETITDFELMKHQPKLKKTDIINHIFTKFNKLQI